MTTSSLQQKHMPGETGLWVFILGDMTMFSMFFGVFAYERAHQVLLFNESQQKLNITFGAVNTLLLLTGSLCVVLGIEVLRHSAQKNLASKYILFAFFSGLGFAINKVFEYGSKIANGITPETNTFFMYFYAFTGIHLLHLLIGMTFLFFAWKRAQRPVLTVKDMRYIENVGIYWHLVDLLWVVLFALLYLLN